MDNAGGRDAFATLTWVRILLNPATEVRKRNKQEVVVPMHGFSFCSGIWENPETSELPETNVLHLADETQEFGVRSFEFASL